MRFLHIGVLLQIMILVHLLLPSFMWMTLKQNGNSNEKVRPLSQFYPQVVVSQEKNKIGNISSFSFTGHIFYIIFFRSMLYSHL